MNKRRWSVWLGSVAIILLVAVSSVPRGQVTEAHDPENDTSISIPVQTGSTSLGNRNESLDLLARVIAAEAQGEPYVGQVAVGAVILNRVQHPDFPNTLAGVIYQPHAFESVTNGLIWRRNPDAQAWQAAQDALNGWDPTYGAVFFWNPYKPVSNWIWSRPIVVQYGNHVFAT